MKLKLSKIKKIKIIFIILIFLSIIRSSESSIFKAIYKVNNFIRSDLNFNKTFLNDNDTTNVISSYVSSNILPNNSKLKLFHSSNPAWEDIHFSYFTYNNFEKSESWQYGIYPGKTLPKDLSIYENLYILDNFHILFNNKSPFNKDYIQKSFKDFYSAPNKFSNIIIYFLYILSYTLIGSIIILILSNNQEDLNKNKGITFLMYSFLVGFIIIQSTIFIYYLLFII